MSTSLPITSTTSLLRPVGNFMLKGAALCAAAATSVLELFEGTIGTIATKAIADGGTGYLVGDTITLVQAGGGIRAVFTVATVDAPETGVITALTLVSGGTGYTAGSTYATTTNSIAGAGATVTTSTVTDAGTSIGKLSCVSGESAPPLDFDCGLLVTQGLSVRISGTNAKGHVYYE